MTQIAYGPILSSEFCLKVQKDSFIDENIYIKQFVICSCFLLGKTILDNHCIVSNFYIIITTMTISTISSVFLWETATGMVDNRVTPENTFCFTFGHPGHPVKYYKDKCSFFLSNIKSQYDPKLSTLNKNALKTSVWNDGQLFLLLRPLRRAREKEGGLKEKQVVIARRPGTLPLSNCLIKRNIF